MARTPKTSPPTWRSNYQNGRAGGLQRTWRAFRQALPQGRLLPEHHWQTRHQTIVTLLWLHIIALGALAAYQTPGFESLVLRLAPLVLLALVAGFGRLNRATRSIAASLGMLSASALLIELSGGYIEAHFHFFFVVGILTLYQDWLPFLIAITYVLVHHGVVGSIWPEAVYNHPDAIAHPWKWAVIDAGFVLAASIANLVAWRVNEQLLRDALTGLPSRLVFMDRLTFALARQDDRRSGVAILFLDLDRFKVFNDTLGHTAGDDLLAAVANRMQKVLRSGQIASRFGGDEFAVLCPDIKNEAEAHAVAERILGSISAEIKIGETRMFPSSSIGVAIARGESFMPEDLIRAADVAMYQAKARGGNRIELFKSKMGLSNSERLEREDELRRALQEDELLVYYQPEQSISSQEIIGFEALVRWEHPRRGVLLPADFIDLAEETGMITEIGTYVLEQACTQLKQWNDARRNPWLMRVNVSARQLQQPEFVSMVEKTITTADIPPEQLCLEITERVLVEDTASAVSILKALKRIGVKLAIDDFGIEYSSLNYLKRFPVDALKIDRSFIRGLGNDESDTAIVAAMINMAHALKMTVTAEGVETEEQFRNLKQLDCDAVQGWLIAVPLPADEALNSSARPTPKTRPRRVTKKG